MSIEVIYECGRLLSINKPCALATQAPSGIDCLELRVKRYLKQRTHAAPSGKTYLGVPHRLDRASSGAMVFAKDKTTARYLAGRFQRREVRKTYWALVKGVVSPDQGSWTDFMRKIPDQAKSEIIDQSHQDAQLAVLNYRVRQAAGDTTLLEIDLETGRSHQIRVQASSRGFPILGDELYGNTIPFGPPSDDQRMRWIALHARQLEIRHPTGDETLCLTAELPSAWNEFI